MRNRTKLNLEINIEWNGLVAVVRGVLFNVIMALLMVSMAFSTTNIEDNDYTNSDEKVPLSEQQLINIESIKFQSSGRDYSPSNWAFAQSITSTNQSTTGDSEEFVRDIATDSSGNAYIIGYFESTTISFGSITLTNSGGTDVYVAKISPSGTWQWAYSAGADGDDVGSGIAVKSNSVYVTGSFTTSISFGTNTLTNGCMPCSTELGGSVEVFVAKASTAGVWQWALRSSTVTDSETTGRAYASAIAVDSYGDVYVGGSYLHDLTLGSLSAFWDSDGGNVASGGYDIFVAKVNDSSSASSYWEWVARAGKPSSEYVNDIDIGPNGNVYIVGKYDAQSTSNSGNHQGLRFDDSGNTGALTAEGQGVQGFVAALNSSGSWLWVYVDTDENNDDCESTSGIDVHSSGAVYVTGTHSGCSGFANLGVGGSNGSSVDLFVAKFTTQGNYQWALSYGSLYDESTGKGVISSNDGVYVTGYTYPRGSSHIDAYILKVSDSGQLDWVFSFGGNDYDAGIGLALDSNENLFVAGEFTSSQIPIGNPNVNSNGDRTVFVALWDDLDLDGVGNTDDSCNNGTSGWNSTTTSDYDADGCRDSDEDDDDDNDGIADLQPDDCLGGDLNWISTSITDYDSDGCQDSVEDLDDDNDQVPDASDLCSKGVTGWSSQLSTDRDVDGCRDSDEDDDDDNDLIDDGDDACSAGFMGWVSNNVTDFDGDGCNDIIEDGDDDNDGYEDLMDLCPKEEGNSTFEYERGCPDTDGDGSPDIRDLFPSNNSEWADLDGDGVGDNADEFDFDSSQHSDTDGDGHGDYLYGNGGDACPDVWGDSFQGLLGCPDLDRDGWSDNDDAFPDDFTQWKDRDGDGYGDEIDGNDSDAFPSDGTQWNDTDEDGHGDNPYGTEGDWFPENPERWQDTDRDGVADEDDDFSNDATQWKDADGDGYGDELNGNRPDKFPNDPDEWMDSDDDGLGNNADDFPFDPTQTVDADGDGMGDNPMGIGADKFPDDSSQWGDIDGDGYGDNQTGTNPDMFITDATQWADRDGDGYGDNPQGRLYDMFPDNPTQWEDVDEDGLGDNQSGTNADPFLNDSDNDGYNDSIDILPKLPSPGDLDADGCLDVDDVFPENPLECLDTDGDGIGDQADSDDDGDGWTDADEDRLGTDSLSASNAPVDSFEIVIPGTAVGLGAWDLIGMFGGIPLFMWIGFGFATRNGRTAKYEALLRDAQTRDELEDVARMWEYSLMLRMLGPHQGIRLERLRAELDDVFEAQNQRLSSIEPQEHDQTQMVEQVMQVEQKSLPSIVSMQPEITAQGNPDGKGYEWYTDGQGSSWYRNEGSNSEWQRVEA